MKKLLAILLCLCLTFIPMNVTALEPSLTEVTVNDSAISPESDINIESELTETPDEQDNIQTDIFIEENSEIIETPIDDGGITITPSGKTPEEQAIEKIIAHKKANGEEIPNETKGLTEDLVDGGVYYIKNYFSGKYLNVHYGVDANGTNVYQWTGDSSTEQKFKIVKDNTNNCYKIYAMCSSNGNNRVLDVVRNGAALASGQNVDIWTPVDHTAQRLILTPLIYDNLFHIHMLGDKNLYFTTIDKSNGTSGGTKPTSAGNVFIQTFDINDNQQWQFIPIKLPDPEPTYAAPYGWLDEVNSNGIRGWAWCEDLSNTALKVEIRLYNSNTGQNFTIPLTANIYRSDVKEAGFGTGNYGFHYDIDWSEYPAGSYTVRAFAGIDDPDTELHDSHMIYNNSLNISSSISENIVKSAYLSVGSEHTYSFTPVTTGTYVVQTFGNADTIGFVTIGSGAETRSDSSDLGGQGDNFKIMFYARQGEPVQIKVERGSQSTSIGNYSIKIHRATAQIYTFNVEYMGYDSIDTTDDAAIPQGVFMQYGYNVSNNQNAEYAHILAQENTGFQRMNSEIVFFAGHGDKIGNESLLIFNSISNKLTYSIMKDHVPDMSNVKIALWANCISSLKGNDDYDNSIARLAHTKGAEVSIGWNTRISDFYTQNWTNSFFEGLGSNLTVDQAICFANSELNNPDSELINKLVVYGNDMVKIVPTTYTNIPILYNTSYNEEALSKLSMQDYVVYNYNYGGKRYVRTINGVITNDFYQVGKNGFVLKSANTFTDEEIKKLSSQGNAKSIYSQVSINELNETLELNIDSYNIKEDKEIYYKTDGTIYHLRAIDDGENYYYIDISSGKIRTENIEFF